MLRALNVYLYGEKIGELTEDDHGALRFKYHGAPYPLSVRMPVQELAYEASFAEPFFDNLTPEGDVLDLLAQKYRMSSNNTFSVLKLIGGECAGAVSLYQGEPVEHIDNPRCELTPCDIAAIIDALPANPLLTGMDCAPRLSLAGAQAKFAVCRAEDGRYYRSDDANPTTHIIKVANKRFKSLLENELFCMSLARTLFPDSVEVHMRMAEGRKFLEIERYDRRCIDGRVERIHQEDFCQMLGYMSRRKYQADGGPSIRQLHEAVLKFSRHRLVDSFKFIQLLIFNYLIGNTDTHAKNFSFVHVNRDNAVVMAPAYDLVSIDIYSPKIVSHEMALVVNGKAKYSSLRRKDWLALFEQLGLNPKGVMRELTRSFAHIVKHAQELAERLNDDPLTASGVYAKILSNITKRSQTIFTP